MDEEIRAGFGAGGRERGREAVGSVSRSPVGLLTGLDEAGGRVRLGTRDEAHLFCSAHFIIALVLLLPSAGRHMLISFGVT